MRGDKVPETAEEWLDQQSPPHARGQVTTVPVFELRQTITPACAGTRLNNDRFYVIYPFDFL